MLVERTDASFRSAYVERYAKYRESQRAKVAAGHDGSIPGTYLTQVISRHAAKDALFTADDGTAGAWAYRHIEANGQRRLFASLASWNDGQWHAVSHWPPKGRTHATSAVHGRRRWNFCSAT
jgi:thiamine pyrophosphate-dependent acetolactate synthase large subunit-like protein